MWKNIKSLRLVTHKRVREDLSRSSANNKLFIAVGKVVPARTGCLLGLISHASRLHQGHDNNCLIYMKLIIDALD